jgi:arylsulfatase A-like enzyme
MAWPGNPAIKGGSVATGFAHVTDMPMTLLKLAGVAPQQGRFAGRPVEPMTGLDLTPMLTGAASSVHSADKPLGYELSGNAVLFKGDYKLVKNLPPYGDGRWRLYNISADPGETLDLSGSDPARFAAMQKDYVAFAKVNKVLPMPEGYTAPKQIFANAMRTLLVPRLLQLWPLGALLGIAIATAIWWRRRRNT